MKIRNFLIKEEWGKIAIIAIFLTVFFISGIAILIHDRTPSLNITEIERIEKTR